MMIGVHVQNMTRNAQLLSRTRRMTSGVWPQPARTAAADFQSVRIKRRNSNRVGAILSSEQKVNVNYSR